MRTSLRPARARTRCQNGWRSVSRAPRFCSHDHTRVLLDAVDLQQNLDRVLTEMHDLGASFECGGRSALSSMSTCAHCSVITSPSRQPVGINRRAATMEEACSNFTEHLSNAPKLGGA